MELTELFWFQIGTAASQSVVSVALSALALAVAEHPQLAGIALLRNPSADDTAMGHARFPTTPSGFTASLFTPALSAAFADDSCAVVAAATCPVHKFAALNAVARDDCIAPGLEQVSAEATAWEKEALIAVSMSQPTC